ncbi:MAG TPA: Crp/Fnr family transcriptional regulator [Chryseolinea sp.]|nr:Crp/Fnr family transcriptional regulator [Chryseolinea sp.]
MYDTLIKYLNSYAEAPLTCDEIDVIQDSFVLKKFRKRQYFLQEGEVCKYTAFIVKGAMRQYRVGDKGEEHIIRLYIENWWASDRESMTKEAPSSYFIDAWEETEALVVSKSDLTQIVDTVPTMTKWLRKVDANFAAATQRRLNAAISLSAEERFHDLEKSYPEFLQRFPRHIIASYLGINRETLSRINSRGVRK